MATMTANLDDALTITPRELAARLDEVDLIDVRPWRERYASGIGFVPGSICVPDGRDRERVVVRADRPALSVLICTSGHRAQAEAHRLSAATGVTSIVSLRGGVLGWCAAGLPTAGRDGRTLEPDEAPLEGLCELPRRLLSCFVGQLVETEFAQGRDGDLDFEGMLQVCVDAECPGASDAAELSLAGWYRVVERAAAMSTAIGTPPASVARNVDHFLALMDDYALRHGARPPWDAG